jgi:hypothetical protein
LARNGLSHPGGGFSLRRKDAKVAKGRPLLAQSCRNSFLCAAMY